MQPSALGVGLRAAGRPQAPVPGRADQRHGPCGHGRGAGYDPRPRYRWTHGAAIIGFPDRHSDLKLGLVLVTAAVLLKLVDTGNLMAFAAAARLALSAGSFGWLVMALGIGGLAVVAAAIWVDRQPPHTMMAAGAVVVALGLTIVGFSNSFATSVLGMFVAGIGGSAVGSLVFYAIAVKGATRYRGTLIGALSMVFTVRLGTRNVDDWLFDALMVVPAISVALTLAGAAVLFRLLPRVFAGSYEPGQTLWEMLAVPSIRRAAVWAAAAFFVASMVTTATDVHLWALMFRSTSGVDDVALQLQTMHIFSGIGVLLWGIAADFYPGRRLFLLAAILLLPAAGALWALDGLPASAVGVVVFGLVRGGLVCLPWVLMAELLPTQHFAKIALGIMFVGGLLGGALGPLLWSPFLDTWGIDTVFWLVLVEGTAVAVVAARLPRPRPRAR